MLCCGVCNEVRDNHHFIDLSVIWPSKVWINQGDIILIGLRDYQDAKADVILRYNPDEARNLKSYGELPETGERMENGIILFYNNCTLRKQDVLIY